MMRWVIAVPGRPHAVNSLIRMAPPKARRLMAQWRAAGEAAARQGCVVCTRPVTVTVTPMLRGRRRQDVGACYLVAKAIIDGLTDAAAWVDDDDSQVRLLSLRPAVYGCGSDSVSLEIEEIEDHR